MKLHFLEIIKQLNLPKPTYNRKDANAVYGWPGLKQSPAWAKENLVKINLPYPMTLAWDPFRKEINRVVVHKYAIDLQFILLEVSYQARILVKKELELPLTTQQIDILTLKHLKDLGLTQFGGLYNHRAVRGGVRLSAHAYGAAIDIDPLNNGLGVKNYKMPDWVIEIFESYGWTAGAKFKRPDAMHFSRVGF